MHYLQIQSYDGADIDGNVSEISATSYLPLSDITDLDEFPTFETENCASTTQNHQPIDEEWNSLKTN